MKTLTKRLRDQKGFSLLVCLVLMGIGVATAASIMSWSQTNTKQTARHTEYLATVYAAESAIENIRASILYDNANNGEATVFSKIDQYAAMIPSASQDVYWANYQFTNPAAKDASCIVKKTATNAIILLDTPFKGLTSIAAKYQIISSVWNKNSQFHVPVTVGLEMNLGRIPLFQYAIFYQDEMEINPGAPMTIRGPVHGNSDIYLSSSAGVWVPDTTASGKIILGCDPDDPTGSRGNNVNFTGAHLSDQPVQNLPVGTNQTGTNINAAANIHAILEIPPPGEPYAYSQIGTNRLYNQADLVLLVKDTGVTAMSGVHLGNVTVLTNFPVNFVLNTNEMFYDRRQSSWVQATAVNVGALKKWSETNKDLSTKLSTNLFGVLYVADQRNVVNVITNILTQSTTTSGYPTAGTYQGKVTTNTVNNKKTYTYDKITGTNISSAMPAIVLTNGTTLPNHGLTVATLDPVYVKGHYNVGTNGTSFPSTATTNTAYTRPASILSDAITILSGNWSNANSTNTARAASSTTVNAAFLTGNVPTTPGSYSGGVENFPRFLENWSGSTFTYNGSMVCMFPSQIADAPWRSSNDVYSPPNRNWSFDFNFLDTQNLPPAVPKVMAVTRGRWEFLPQGTTQF